MDVLSLLIAGSFMAVLGIALAALLAFANQKLFVEEDPRVGEVEAMLPHSNCGACGCAGCRAFAEKIVQGDAMVAQCTVSSPEQAKAIALYLNVDLGTVEKRVARLACAGGRHVAYLRARYAGYNSCRAAHAVSGGGKECAWGCLGLADCMKVCDFGAIHMDIHGLPVVDPDKCAACNDCVEVCPKGLFSLEQISHQLWVACKSQADGQTAEKACEVACTACGKCVMDSKEGVMSLENNLATVHYAFNDLTERKAIDRCPTGAIVWYEKPNHPVRGVLAKKILRNGALPLLH